MRARMPIPTAIGDTALPLPARPKLQRRRGRFQPAVLGFLAPNFVGFLAFTLMPVLFSLAMAFTNWTLREVPLEFVGLRNFTDMLGVQAIEQEQPALKWGYVACAGALAAGLIGALWANVSQWKGTRLAGAVFAAGGLAAAAWAALDCGGEGVILAGLVLAVCGLFAMLREDSDWRPGWGVLPALFVAAGAAGLWLLREAMWGATGKEGAYEANDARFWKFLYNTMYLMLAIPFSILGSLALAMLVNNRFGLSRRPRVIGAALCLMLAGSTLGIVWHMGYPNLALLGGIFWMLAAFGVAFDVVSFRTLYYLPAFTAGVAIMVLWKALYNPKTGPINLGLSGLLEVSAESLPGWLTSVAWAKPALIIMGFWMSIGGTNMLLYLAGLSNVPQELLDAAEVDGAGWWGKFRHVTWPQLAPTTFFITVMAIIGGFQGGFEQARVMTNGGPAGSTTTLSFYIYNKFYNDVDMGYGAAIAWVLFGIIFVATAINWKYGKELEVGP